jgi:glycosyltransferase involved in cell wall biosynthesis
MEAEFGLCFEGRLNEELGATGRPVHQLGAVRFSRPWTVYQARRRLRRLIQARRYQVVVCHDCWPYAVFAPTARAAGLPLVFWAHGTPRGTHWLDWIARRIAPDLVLANSHWIQRRLPSLFPSAPSEVLYYPVPDRTPPDRDATRRLVRSALDSAPESVVIVQTSRLEPWKGHEFLLHALGRLAGLPGWECWIAGGAQRPKEVAYLGSLQRLASDLGLASRVRFLGQRSDVPALLAAADIHCQPNLGEEPFGIAFLEALYAGLPVVTSGHGGALEVVHESCGVLVRPGDDAALAEAIGSLIRNPEWRKRLGEAGPEHASRLCAPADRLRQLACHLQSLTADSLPQPAVGAANATPRLACRELER